MNAFRLIPFVILLMTGSCSTSIQRTDDTKAFTDTESVALSTRVLKIADEYVDAYYQQFADEAYEVGYPKTPMDKLGNRSMMALREWEAKEDAWLNALQQISARQIADTDAAIAYAFTRNRLEASVARRVCKMALWNISPTFTGWQSLLASTFAQQPIATESERAIALTRLGAVSAYLDTELSNLREGMKTSFLAPKVNVHAVITQIDALLADGIDASPFYEPATRSNDEAFREQVRQIIIDRIHPAIERYRRFLLSEYHGRDAIGVSANPDGAACYAASVAFHTSLNIDAATIHQMGLREMASIEKQMAQIALQEFKTTDVKALLEQFRSDPHYAFKSEQDVLQYARAAVDRAERASHQWFGFVPKAELIVKPFPAYLKSSGGGFYSSGSLDGSRPGTYELGTYEAHTISKVGIEATAFHESYPGHHLQMSVALFGKGVHSVLRYLYVASMAEGWGLYSELLVDEMKLYSSPADRMGMLSNQAFRAARLVVDSGMHALGWSREQAVEYMLAHTAEQRSQIESEINRYLATPAQATAYMIGSLEIQRLRRDAEQKLGHKFDIKTFHDLILGDGAVTLPMLQTAIDKWAKSK